MPDSFKQIRIGRFPALEYMCDEAMNTLCTNLSYCGPDIRTVMITSRYASEGKSYVAMNLMRSLAKLGRRVVLLDADLRASGIQSHFDLQFPDRERLGMTDYLAGKCGLSSALYQTNVSGAYLMPCGHEAPNPLQLLDSSLLGDLIQTLEQSFDIVLVDTPPAGIIVDAVALAKYCDGALIVVSYRRGHEREIGDIVQKLGKTGCRVLGAVLNNVDFKRFSNRKYYYNSEQYASYYDYNKYAYRYGSKKRS